MRNRWILHVVFFFLLALCSALFAWTQESHADQKDELELRTVHGSVIDKSESPVPSSVIYMKNTKTLAVATHIAPEDGSYRFSGLDPNVDYEIHAEHDDLMSSTRTVSRFDSRRDIEVILKLSRKKPAR